MKKTYIIESMDCASCATKLERKLSKVKGISDVNVDFMMKKVQFTTKDDFSEDSNKKTENILKKQAGSFKLV